MGLLSMLLPGISNCTEVEFLQLHVPPKSTTALWLSDLVPMTPLVKNSGWYVAVGEQNGEKKDTFECLSRAQISLTRDNAGSTLLLLNHKLSRNMSLPVNSPLHITTT